MLFRSFHPNTWNCGDRLQLIKNYCSENNIQFEFIIGNTLQMQIEETDLLFIDTLHAYKQLNQELTLHGNKAKKYIILHDTSSYEYSDERNSYTNENMDSPIRGLWPAVEEFLKNNNHWKIQERRLNNNGLTILKRD
mgnify:CR=1 FL=1